MNYYIILNLLTLHYIILLYYIIFHYIILHLTFILLLIYNLFKGKATATLNVAHRHLQALKIKVNNLRI